MTDEHERNNRWIIDKPFRDAHKDIDSNLAGWDYIKKLESEAAQSAEKIARLSKVIMPMQDAIDERDEKIARLEAENASLGAQIDRLNDQCDDWKEQAAAAELSNKQLREALHAIADDDSNHEVFTRGYLMKTAYEIVAREALAQQPSTEALDAYVAKETEELREFAIWLTGCGYDFTKHQYFMDNRHLLHRSFPPAPDKDKE